MTLWAHTMVKNEGRWLWYAVNSVIDHIDKLLLWDTGSTDESREIEIEIEKRYKDKIILKHADIKTPEDFTKVRQEMLDQTKSDWFMMLDGDEIWWEESIAQVISSIKSITSITGNKTESIVVPTVNLVGDIYHYQDKSAGRYKFGKLEGHYNLRFIKRGIEGLHSQGVHGIWGWADGDNKMIQDRNTYKFVDAPYLHATNIERSVRDGEVIKRSKKLKYENGIEFPLDYYYPEVFFRDKQDFVKSPWKTVTNSYKFRSFFETPIRKMKRKFIKGKVGY